MEILITESGYLCLDEDKPEIGKKYRLEDIAEGTEKQNKAFHALVGEYYKTGAWSYTGSGYKKGVTFAEFRDLIKRNLGAGFESYVYADYVDGKAIIKKAKKKEDIPGWILADKDWSKMVLGKLKSWSKYTKVQRLKTIDNLIAEMINAGVQTKHFFEILEGIKGENNGH